MTLQQLKAFSGHIWAVIFEEDWEKVYTFQWGGEVAADVTGVIGKQKYEIYFLMS